MRNRAFCLSLFLLCLASAAPAKERAREGVEMDSLLAKVGRDAVLLSDLRLFVDVDKVLACAGVISREKPLPTDRRALLDAYIEEELMYQEARAKKISTNGSIPETVQMIHDKPSCKSSWQRLGERYSRYWRTESRAREGEALLVRELEKRVLVEKLRRSKLVTDYELWKREAKLRYPVKVYAD